jgi:hypothetical protein
LKTEIRDSLTQDEWDGLPTPAGYGPWSHTDHLLAAVHDRVAMLDRTLVQVNSKPGTTVPMPTPYPRPGVGPVRGAGGDDGGRKGRREAAVMAYMLEHNGAPPPPDWNWESAYDTD